MRPPPSFPCPFVATVMVVGVGPSGALVGAVVTNADDDDEGVVVEAEAAAGWAGAAALAVVVVSISMVEVESTAAQHRRQ